MNIYTVSLFGHREIEDLRLLEARLTPIIKELILSKEYVSFLIGRNGEFDEYAASIIKTVRKQLGSESSDLTLVLPYYVADIEYYEKYYDGIIIPEIAYRAHPKSAITLRNRYMVKESDLVIFHVESGRGGAFTSMKYAKQIGKKFINLTDHEQRTKINF